MAITNFCVTFCVAYFFLNIHSIDGVAVEESASGAILSFPELIDGDLFNVTWEVEPAAFGYADYGGTLEAFLVLPMNPSNHTECDAEPDTANPYIHLINDYEGSDALWILVIDRGDCDFATKVYNAERIGAAGVIMLDFEYEGDLTMYKPDDFEHDITIPSVMLPMIYGESLMKHLGVQNWDPTNINSTTYPLPMSDSFNSFIITKAVIEWGLPHEDNRVEWELWTSSNDDRTMKFKKNFQSTALTLDLANYTIFTPHYYILDGTDWQCDTKFPKCGNQCTNQGRYCAVDPERDLDLGISGLDVVQEDLRQLCIWNFTTHGSKSAHNESVWWEYSVLWNDNCFNNTYNEDTFNTGCSYEQMATLENGGRSGLIAYVNNCIETSGGYGYDDNAINTLLDYEIRLREATSIHVLPTFRINEFMMYGEIDCQVVTVEECSVLDSICLGFLEGTQPDVCYDHTPKNCSSVFQDCEGRCYGTKKTDRCGSCLEISSADWDSCVGCDNVTNSGKEWNPCGKCISNTAFNFNSLGKDCSGTCDGTKEYDDCGQCLEPSDAEWNSCNTRSGINTSSATNHDTTTTASSATISSATISSATASSETTSASITTSTATTTRTASVHGSGNVTSKKPIDDHDHGSSSSMSIQIPIYALVGGVAAVFVIFVIVIFIVCKLNKKQMQQTKQVNKILKEYAPMDKNNPNTKVGEGKLQFGIRKKQLKRGKTDQISMLTQEIDDMSDGENEGDDCQFDVRKEGQIG